MDFTKIKVGVLDFSSFLVSHAAWLLATLYSVWVALGARLAPSASAALTTAVATLNNPAIVAVADNYGLKPLAPALVFFVGMFVLHAHRELLARAGRYVPPDLVMHWRPGLKAIDVGRWHYVLSQLPDRLSFRDVRALLDARYDAAVEKRRPRNLLLNFNLFKSLAILNLALAMVPSNTSRGTSLAMFAVFSVAASVAAVLHVYHSQLTSRWAIDDVLRDLIAEQAMQEGTERRLTVAEQNELKDVVSAERKTRTVTFSWNIPLIGSWRILSETVLHANAERGS